jgi:hypothetical protein
MHTTIRSLAVLIVVMLGMALLHGAIEAATGSNAIILGSPADIVYTRQVTGTVYPSDSPTTPALTSLWQTQYYSFNASIIPSTFPISITPPLFPSDAQVLTYGIAGGSAVKVGQLITFVVTSTDSVFSFDYLTQKQAVLEGDRYRVDQIASANGQYRYISTVYFTEPYHYSGFINETPTTVSSYTVSWDVLPSPNNDGKFRFDSSIWLTNDQPYLVLLPVVLEQY